MVEKLKDFGEKIIIRDIIKPLFNPNNLIGGVGDDCAIIKITDSQSICISTDRVPADLISFKIGLIDYYELGYYLSILNISDIASCGADPIGLLLTFAFENDFSIINLKALLNGVSEACKEYGCSVLGGDLSNSSEMSISATSIGIAQTEKILYRSNAKNGDYIFCSDYIGLTPTAFKYFLQLKPTGFNLTDEEESILANQFRKPKARVKLGRFLSENQICTSCMDNTDGVSQTFCELSEINGLAFCIEENKLPIHDISFKIAEQLNINIIDIVLSAGADFQLLGTLDKNISVSDLLNTTKLQYNIKIIGKTERGKGVLIKNSENVKREFEPQGWNYYIK